MRAGRWVHNRRADPGRRFRASNRDRRVELLRKSNFHAAEEAVKGIFDRLREETGSALDGGDLIDEVFAFRDVIPVLALSKVTSKSEQSEQSGFMRQHVTTARNGGLAVRAMRPIGASAWPLIDLRGPAVATTVCGRAHEQCGGR